MNFLPILAISADLVKYGLIHIPLRGLASDLASYSDKVLLQRHRTERRVEEEQSLVPIDPIKWECRESGRIRAARTERRLELPQEIADINVIGQRGRQSHDTNQRLTRLDLSAANQGDFQFRRRLRSSTRRAPTHQSKGSGDNGLDDRSSILIQQMHFIDDEQFHFLIVSRSLSVPDYASKWPS